MNKDESLQMIDAIVNRFIQEKNIPGISMQIVSDGKTFFTYESGYSHIESRKRMNQDSLSSIMSLTKSFTANALLHLAEHTYFKLDTPIVDYLPYFRTKKGHFNQITTNHILSHTAGFPENIWLVTLLDKDLFTLVMQSPEYHFIFKQVPDIEKIINNIKSREDITKYFSSIELEYEPGEGWKYCTDAYVIAADILEKVSGLTWEEYVIKHIIKPLNMNSTYINPSLKTSIENMSHYYLYKNGDYHQVPFPYNPLGAPVGFIYSSTNDMAKYLIAHMDNKQKIISISARNNMFVMMAPREPGLSYGLGWKIKRVRNLKIMEHAGGCPGVSSFAAMIPEKNFGLVILCNTGEIPLQKISDQIIDSLYLSNQ